MNMQEFHEKVRAFVVETFDPHVSEKFQVTWLDVDGNSSNLNSEVVELELTEVTRFPKIKELEGTSNHRAREPFSLLFVGSHEQPLVGGIYQVQHDRLGTFSLALTPVQVSATGPVESNPDGRFYEAVFG
jgi:hypothetical protein